MRLHKIVFLFGILLTIAGCGGGSITLDNFLPMTKTEGDVAFVLVAPSSKSPAAFTFTSSDPTVATISGSTVTVLLAGTTTITAAQPGLGSYSPTSATAVLTVLPIVCTGTNVRVNGVCVAPCIAPSTLQNGVCTAPAFGTGTSSVSRNGTTFAPVERIDNWTNANEYCKNTIIAGLAGWRLPNQFELEDLFASGLANGKGWVLSETWSSTPFMSISSSRFYYVVDTITGQSQGKTDGTGAYVSCVR